jgi:hypothetical protein
MESRGKSHKTGSHPAACTPKLTQRVEASHPLIADWQTAAGAILLALFGVYSKV